MIHNGKNGRSPIPGYTDPFIDESDPSWRIQDAGKKVFAECGYERTSISAICKKAGVNRAMVSYYHGGKLTLYRIIMETAVGRFTRHLRETVYNIEEPLKRLRAFIEIQIGFYLNEREIGKIIEREMGSNFVNAGDILTNNFIQALAILTDVIQQGIDSGDFDKSITPNDAAIFIIGAVSVQFVLNSFTQRIIFSPELVKEQGDRLSDRIFNLVVYGISPKGIIEKTS